MLRGRALRWVAWPVLALTAASGCYRYVPVPNGDLNPGAAYRGYLTPEGSQRIAPYVGQDVERFDGRVVSVLDTAYLVAMGATVRRGDPRSLIWSGEQINVPRTAVSRFELRELDRPKTLRAVALYAVGMVAASYLWFSVKGGAAGNCCIEPPPPP